MARRIQCPWPEHADAWIELPDEWLGVHAVRYDQALVEARNKELPATWTRFALAMAIIENWDGLPGLNGNPDKWRFEDLKLELVAWLTRTALGDYDECWNFPKGTPPL